jgi:selenocysteine-specific elongation factor
VSGGRTAMPADSADSPTDIACLPAGTLPVTLGTAGHIDHGKTALVRAMTGIDTDRLPEEKARGVTIALGFAPLQLPNGRVLSLVDVPGHERLIRTMVSGATGIDLFLLVVAADDGVMPQTIEHLRVLEALGICRGVVAITKSDLADPQSAVSAAHTLLPAAEIIPCSARTGMGVTDVLAALARAAADAPMRAASARAPVLHIDRVFTIRGAGTVVTGTLWSGIVTVGDRLNHLPQGHPVRVRALQVHDRAVPHAQAGQRVALNLAGVARRAVSRGDVLAGTAAVLNTTHRIEVSLALHAPVHDRERLQVHHGTRDTAARAVYLQNDRWQLRLERPLIASDGDRVVMRRISPPDTLGGGTILTAAAGGRHSEPPVTRPSPPPAPAPPTLDTAALALEARLREAGHAPPSDAELGADPRTLRALRESGRAVRLGPNMHAHAEAIVGVRAVVERIARTEGSITLARLRDELGTSRKYAQALLEHCDAAHLTIRREDDRRVLKGSSRR